MENLITVSAIVAFAVTFIAVVTYGIVRSVSKNNVNIYSSKRADFERKIQGKEHYSVWTPDEQSIWRQSDIDSFFLEFETPTLLTTQDRSYWKFSYNIDSEEQRIYLWKTHMFMDRVKCNFSDFRTPEQARKAAAGINTAIEANRRAV